MRETRLVLLMACFESSNLEFPPVSPFRLARRVPMGGSSEERPRPPDDLEHAVLVTESNILDVLVSHSPFSAPEAHPALGPGERLDRGHRPSQV